MKINFKVRLRNPVFWLTVIPATATVVYTVLSALGVAPKISQSEAVNVLSIIVSVLTEIGVFVDPTTKGTGDSERALGYDEPGE